MIPEIGDDRLNDLIGNLHDQAALLGQRDKVVRRHQRAVGALPTHQCFAADTSAGL